MGLKKGMTNNKKGRPKGKPNKVTGDLRQWISELLDNNRKQIIADLKKLDPDKRLMFLEKLMGYAVPKMQQSDINMNIDRLTDEQADAMVSEILKKLDDGK